MIPSRAARPDFDEARAIPLFRRTSIADSMSPLASAKAFLHSIIPAPVRSRSSLTSEAVIVIRYSFLLFRFLFGWVRSGARDRVRFRRRGGSRRGRFGRQV